MIKLHQIHRNFQVGDQVVHALDDINLEIGAGEYVSIMGPSGSGKSTLLNLMASGPAGQQQVLAEWQKCHDIERTSKRRHVTTISVLYFRPFTWCRG